MTDNAIIEIAKAKQEIAKTAGKAIDAASGFGNFCEKVFGDLLQDSIGLVADRMKYFRDSQLEKLQQKTEEKLKIKNVEQTRPVHPNIGIPLIQEAGLVEDNYLQSKWASLLANAMNPNYSEKIKRRFVTILADVEPIEAKIMQTLFDSITVGQLNTSLLIDSTKVQSHLKISASETVLALRNLLRLGLIKPGVVEIKTEGTLEIKGGFSLSSYQGIRLFQITELGLEFSKAIAD